MNAKTITSAVITVVLGVTLAMPTTALADRDDRGHRQGHSQHDGKRHRQNRQQHREFKRHNRDHREHKRHSKRHYKEDRHRAKRHYREDRHHAKRHYKKHKRHYEKHHDGYYNRHHGHRKYGHGYGGGYGSNYYYDDDDDEKLLIGLVVGGILGYALNESQQDDGDFYDNSYVPAETARYNNGTCLQEREYQTTVLVGGRKVDAYGTACLQPDGSWKRSLPTVPAY